MIFFKPNFLKKNWKLIKSSTLSGILIGLSYIPFPPWALFFCLIPLWSVFLKEDNPKKIFLWGWITQFVLAIIGFHWIPATIVEFGHFPKIIGILGLVAFATISNLHIPLAGLVWWRLKKSFSLSQTHSLIVIALLTALLEKFNPQIFPWYMGYGWYYGDLPAFQLADIIGVTGLSTLTYLLNAWIFIIYLGIKNRQFFKKQLTYIVLFFALINALGLLEEKIWSKTDSSFKALLVQPNIGNQEKQWEIFGYQYKEHTLSDLQELTKSGLSLKPDLVIWPETAVPEFLNEEFLNLPSVKPLINFIKDSQINLLTGAFSKNIKENRESNSIFLFNTQGQLQGTYKKHILLAFGEYLPLSNLFPSLLKYLPTIADFERGKGPHTIRVNNLKIGPQICYEGLHPWFTQALERDGANILINITNDSWFGHTFEPYQHLYMTFMRAIEFRRPMVRVTNTGISSVVSATGKTLIFSPQKEKWSQTIEIPFRQNPPRTFYSYFIYLDHLISIVALLVLLLINSKLYHKPSQIK